MIFSMTGFAKYEWQNQWGSFAWEVRSLNNRYLDINIKLPELFRDLEMQAREKVREKLQRGKLDLFLRIQLNSNMQSMAIDEEALEQLQNAVEKLSGHFPQAQLDLVRLLQWPGVLKSEELVMPDLQQEGIKGLEQLLLQLLDARQREGQNLKKMILDRLQEMRQYVSQAKAVIPEVLQLQREKLLQRLQDAQVTYVQERIDQELVLAAQRIDVAEEIDRLSMHIDEMQRILEQGGAVGRRLDFLTQEMHREANTLGSKSTHSVTTKSSLELKILIEQIREQVQNIE